MQLRIHLKTTPKLTQSLQSGSAQGTSVADSTEYSSHLRPLAPAPPRETAAPSSAARGSQLFVHDKPFHGIKFTAYQTRSSNAFQQLRTGPAFFGAPSPQRRAESEDGAGAVIPEASAMPLAPAWTPPTRELPPKGRNGRPGLPRMRREERANWRCVGCR